MCFLINADTSLFERDRRVVALLVVATTGVAVHALQDLRASDNLRGLFFEHRDRVTSLYDIRKPVFTLRRRMYRRMFPTERADAEDVTEFRDLAAGHPLVKGQFLSDDRRATQRALELDPAFPGIPLQLTGATVFVMCSGIAVDDTIRALTVDRRLCSEGVPPHEAIERGFAEIGVAIVSTTVILIAGISVVMLGPSLMTTFFGGLFIGGLLWAFAGDLLLPATLACFPPRQPTTAESGNLT